jgi:hypothetical protein
MPELGDCRLCQSVRVELQDSHIVPEFLYKRIYTGKHKFKPISVDCSNYKLEQKGYRENLLCSSCETKLSRWENKLRDTLEELITENYDNLSVCSFGDITHLDNLEYDSIKKAILSIFWRLSISRLPVFSDYNFGPYDEKLRCHLDSNSNFSNSSYPIMISKALIAGKFYSGILMPVERGRYGNDFIMQSIVLNGFLFQVLMSEGKPIPGEVLRFCIKDNGAAFMRTSDFSNYGLSLDNFQVRANDPDVVDFFKRYN